MTDGNGNGHGPADRRAEGERIDRGPDGGPSAVADLLARVRGGTTLPTPAPPTPPPPVTEPTPAEPTPARPVPATDPDRLAADVAAVTARVIGVPALDPDTDLFDAGGTSVHAVELVGALTRELGVRLPLDDVFADGRPRRLARRWLTTADPAAPAAAKPAAPAPVGPDAPATADPAASVITIAGPAASVRAPAAPRVPAVPARPAVPADARPTPGADPDELAEITADLARADALPWVGPPVPLAPTRLLITGTTGFLGAHLLLDLLRHSDAHAVCLVRGRDDADAQDRLGAALRGFDLPWSAEIRRRVTVLAGDLRAPRLGLSDDRWDTLTREVDSVVGVGAAVDFLRGYTSLRRTNVHGPLTLAGLAMTGRPKPLHHISSVAVFNEIGVESMGEDDPVAHVDRLRAGYDRTKWAAESALRRAREHGLVATFLRPGGIVGHTVTGAYNTQDLSSGLLSAFSRYRTVPAFRYLNVAPVDWVSRTAAAVICDPQAWGQNYNLTGRPNTLAEMVRDMELSGLNIQVLDWDEWRSDFLRRAAADPVPQLEFLVRCMRSPAAVALCEAQLRGPAATAERTDRFVAKHDLKPAARYDGAAGLRNYERMARDGLVRLPQRADPPYLWFPETLRGKLGPVDGERDTRCVMRMTLSVASMYQLVRQRTIHTRGTLACTLLHPEPLTVEAGDIWVRPDEGVPLEHGTEQPLLRYRLVLRDDDGGRWWLEGWKFSRARRDWWKQARRLRVRIGREGEPASVAGVVTVPGKSYVKQQIDGIRADPRLSAREQRIAKLTWLTWFGLQMGQGLLEPSLRAAADLLDLRPDAVDRDRDRVQEKIKKLVEDRERLE